MLSRLTQSLSRRIRCRKQIQPHKKEIDNHGEREENIKKINDQLEQLTDDELDQVAGSTYNNTAADSRILNKMGFDIEGKSANDLFWSQSGFRNTADKVSRIFNKFGISVDQSWGAVDNKYYFGGERITREQAFKILADKVGQPMPDISY